VFGLFGKKSSGWVGVDIGSSAVKLVSLSRQGKGIGIDAYAIVALPATAVVDGNVQEVTEVSAGIEKGLQLCKGAMKTAVAAVPSSAVITKRLELSNSFTEYELEDQVRVEADQFIPYPLDEVALDFQVMSENENTGLQDLLLVACRRTDVELREDAINGAGLKCDIVDVDTYAMERVYPKLPGDEVGASELIGVADVGAATLTLNVFRDGELIYNREQAFGGNDLSNAIHQQYGMPVEEAEQALRSGEIGEEIREMLVMPFRHAVAQQVSRALQFFYSSGSHAQLSRLYLAGGSASIDGISDVLAEEIGIDTQIANPFTGMTVNSKLNSKRLESDAPTLVKACGLAMRMFDQ